MGKGVTIALYSPDLYIIRLALLTIVLFVLCIWRERDLMPTDQDQNKSFLYPAAVSAGLLSSCGSWARTSRLSCKPELKAVSKCYFTSSADLSVLLPLEGEELCAWGTHRTQQPWSNGLHFPRCLENNEKISFVCVWAVILSILVWWCTLHNNCMEQSNRTSWLDALSHWPLHGRHIKTKSDCDLGLREHWTYPSAVLHSWHWM